MRDMSPPGGRSGGIVVSIGLLALVTGAIFALRPLAPVLSLGVLYLFAVLPVAVLYGLAYAIPVAVASMLAFNWFFLPPHHTFELRESENWVALAVYLMTAIVVSELAAGARRRASEARQREREATFAADVSALLLEAGPVQDKLRRIADRAAGVLGTSGARIEVESLRRPESGEIALELLAGVRRVGRLFLRSGDYADPARAERVLPTLASLLASAIDRERLALRAVEAEALRRSDALKTAILRTLSHDLRSPITAISAAGELLEGDRGALSADERSELAASIRLEADRLHRLVSNLLDISRLEVGAAHPRPELWTVDGLVARALNALGDDAARVAVSLPAELPTLRVDAAQIERVLVNVLENALRSSSPTDDVEILGAREGDELVVRVVDHGPGLARTDLERLFEPFERGGTTGDGPGLGLAIAKGFAEANGGRLWAESAPGEGATFALSLPAADMPARVGS
jgi:two-component system, OmpR family, sensor histidine kinase KdpD